MVQARGKKFLLALAVSLGLGLTVGIPSAHAQNGNWSWGACGSLQNYSAGDREQVLINSGVADPCVNYWTPFYGRYDGPNYWVGSDNTGYQNTFAVNHDINANFGIPYLGYIDIFTPLMGTNERAIASAVQTMWNNLVGFVSNVWSSITSLFSNDYTSYNDTGNTSGGSYPTDGSYDDSFVDGFSGYGSYYGELGGGGEGCLVAGTPVTMADGTTRPIEKVKKGELVLAFDQKHQAVVASPVETNVVHKNFTRKSNTVAIETENGTLRATTNHRFLVNNRWVRADQIEPGDTLMTATPSEHAISALPGVASAGAERADVTSVKVKGVRKMAGVPTVYALIVHDELTYFVNGVLTHSFVE